MSTELEILNSLCARNECITAVHLNDNGVAKTLYVKQLFGDSLEAFQEACDEKHDQSTRLVGILRLTLCNSKGELLITSDEVAAKVRNGMRLKDLITLSSEASKVNGFSIKDDEDDDPGN